MINNKIIIDMYNKGMSMSKIASLVGYKSQNSVKNILIKNNIKIRSKAGFKPEFNENFFENIDSEEKAYWLGFFTADGNVYPRKNSQPCLRIELSIKDKYILEQFKNSLNLYVNVRKTRKQCCILQWHSQKMFDDLFFYGVVPNKTKKEKFVILNNELMNHYIRGFFDGDGWVTNTTSHGKRKGSRKCIGFCGNPVFLNDLRTFLNKEIGTKNLKIADRAGCSQLLYSSKEDVENLIKYMYHNSNIFLKRKKDECYKSYTNIEIS